MTGKKSRYRSSTRSQVGLVMLGTAGGPPWWYGSERHGIASALVIGDAVYLVDCGEGWGPQYRRAGLGPTGFQQGIEQLRAVFLTHLHSDHVVDYPNLLTLAWSNGARGLASPVQIFGPGDRGVLPPIFGSADVEPRVIAPGSPTPGTVEMTQRIYEAFASDLNDRTRDYLLPDLDTMFTVRDIALPVKYATDPNLVPAPSMEPFQVYEDDRVRVSAILVDHAPVFPAYAFRFDTDEASVVFSGDTTRCDNLVRIAEGTDILVHEVIDPKWVEGCFGSPSVMSNRALIHHLLAAHTSIEEVGPIAEKAGAKTLVLSHLVPANNPEERWLGSCAGYSGQVVVGQDLLWLGLSS